MIKQFNDVSSTILATCLSQEGITITHANKFKASFDIKTRVLTIPSTKFSVDKDVTIALTLHEVGHALYTGLEYGEAQKEHKIPNSLINIIEDIRIEKLIKRKYKGAKRVMIRSALKLFKDGLFGTPEEIAEYEGLDIVNIFYKCGSGCGLKLPTIYSEVYPAIDAMETFEDVVEVCLTLMKQNAKQDEEEDENGEDKETKNELPEPDNDEDKDDEEGENESLSNNSDDENENEEEEETESSNSGQNEETDSDKEDDNEITNDKSPSDNSLGEMKSQDKFDENFNDKFNDQSAYTDKIYIKNVTPEKPELIEADIVIPFEKYKNSIKAAISESYTGYGGVEYVENYAYHKSLYPAFISDIKRTVNHMANTFERLKSAAVWERTKSHNVGSLNLKKLHQYKYNDDIFNKGQTVSAGKNHGILMMIDYSGSMSSVIPEELKQIIITAMFARKVDIPFEAYSFTSAFESGSLGKNVESTVEEVSNSSLNDSKVVELINSSLSKKDFEQGIFNLFITRTLYAHNYSHKPARIPYNHRNGAYQALGGTPLSSSMLIIEKVMGAFVKKHNLEIPTFILITDGAGCTLSTASFSNNTIVGISDNNKLYSSATEYGFGGTKEVTMITSMIKEKYNANIIGYFIAERVSRKSIERIYNLDLNVKINNAVMNKKGYIELDIDGFDQFFMISGKAVETNTDDLKGKDIKDIKKQFRANSKSITNNKVFASKVIEIVATAA